MIKKLFLVAVFLVGSFAITFHLLGGSITGLVSNAVLFAKTQLQLLTTFIKSNLTIVLGAIGSVATVGTVIWRKISGMRAQTQAVTEQAQALQTEAYQVTSGLQKQNMQLQEQMKTVQAQLTAEIGELKADIAAKDSLIEQQKRELDRLRAEEIAASRISEKRIAEILEQRKRDATRAP